MKFLLGNMLRGASLLVLCGTSFSAASQNPNNYDQELQQLRSAWSSADQLHRLVLADRILRLRDYIGDPGAISATFAEIERQTSPENGLVHAEAGTCLNDIAIWEGGSSKSNTKHWYQDEEQRRAVLAEARKNAEQNASSADGLDLLAYLEHIAGLPEAAEHMQRAAELAPTVARWEQAAAFVDDPLKKFSALQAGLALDAHSQALQVQLALYYVG